MASPSRPFRPQPSGPASTACDNRSDAPFLPHDGDRLCEQPSPPRDRVREDHRGRDRALQAAARGRDLVRDGQRRALAERVSPRPGGGSRSARVLRPDGGGVQVRLGSARRVVRRFHPNDPAAPSRRRAGAHSAYHARLATCTRAPTRAGTASAAKRSSRRRISSTAGVRCTAWSSGSPRRTISSGCRRIATSSSQHFAAHPEFLEPDVRRNEILRLLESGLEDISISRAGQHWGIPVPDDPDSVVYVWFDALINYASAVGLRHRSANASSAGGRPTST